MSSDHFKTMNSKLNQNVLCLFSTWTSGAQMSTQCHDLHLTFTWKLKICTSECTNYTYFRNCLGPGLLLYPVNCPSLMYRYIYTSGVTCHNSSCLCAGHISGSPTGSPTCSPTHSPTQITHCHLCFALLCSMVGVNSRKAKGSNPPIRSQSSNHWGQRIQL